MSNDFQPLIDRILAHESPLGTPSPTLFPPPSLAEWERFHLVYDGVDIPSEVYDLYSIANGFSTGHLSPYGARWDPLPFEPPPRPSFPAPCRPEAQLPIVNAEPNVFILLCEGPQAGEVWHTDARSEAPDVRVAHSLLEFFEHLAIIHEAGETVTMDVSRQEWHTVYPTISRRLAGDFDVRPLEVQAQDGGWPIMYHREVDPEWEEYFQRRLAAASEWNNWCTAWRKTHFPDLKPVGGTPGGYPGTYFIPPPDGTVERRDIPGSP